MGLVLGGFQDQVEQSPTGRYLWQQPDGKWEPTSSAAVRKEAGFEAIGEYIWRRHNMVAQFIATRSILDLCEETERTPVGVGGHAVVVASRYRPIRGQGEGGRGGGRGRGQGRTLTGKHRKTPGLGQRQRIVQNSKLN